MNLRPFEIVLIGIFAIAAIAGLIYLSNAKGGDGGAENQYGGGVELWGTFSQTEMQQVISEIALTNNGFSAVTYKRIDPRTFEEEFVDAIAEGRAPDLVILPHDLLVTMRTKLYPIPYETLPERTFKDTYIDGADIFMQSDGVYGIPLAVDPLVMYWNRDLFSAAGLALPPTTWEELSAITTPSLTVYDAEKEIQQSAIGLGEYGNLSHAKEILSLLFLQAGSSIVERNDNSYLITLNRTVSNATPPAQSAISFFTQFASPGSAAYTWNRTKSLDATEFTNGRLAMYLGFGSEAEDIGERNPNIRYDMAQVPQGGGVTVRRNYGTFYALAIPRASDNIAGAYKAALDLTSPGQNELILKAYRLAPVHRALYSTSPTGVYDTILRQSALIAEGWLDPNPSESDAIFKNMIESITSGRERIDGVVSDAVLQLETLFR